HNRHSSPQCKKLGDLNDSCNDDNTPRNVKLPYPNGDELEASDVYTHFCPCKTGLTCLDSS
ncbi:Astakine-like protein, partial [Dinothrombium tinctorium]